MLDLKATDLEIDLNMDKDKNMAAQITQQINKVHRVLHKGEIRTVLRTTYKASNKWIGQQGLSNCIKENTENLKWSPDTSLTKKDDTLKLPNGFLYLTLIAFYNFLAL